MDYPGFTQWATQSAEEIVQEVQEVRATLTDGQRAPIREDAPQVENWENGLESFDAEAQEHWRSENPISVQENETASNNFQCMADLDRFLNEAQHIYQIESLLPPVEGDQIESLLPSAEGTQPIQDQAEEITCASSAERHTGSSCSVSSEDPVHESVPNREDISMSIRSLEENRNFKTASEKQVADDPSAVENNCRSPSKLDILRAKITEILDPRLDAEIPRPLKKRIEDLQGTLRNLSFESKKVVEEIEGSKRHKICEINREFNQTISKLKTSDILERQREFEEKLKAAEVSLEEKKKEIEERRLEGEKAKEDLTRLKQDREAANEEVKRLNDKISNFSEKIEEKENAINQINLLSSSREEEDVASNKTEIRNCAASYKANIENAEQVKNSAIEKVESDYDNLITSTAAQQKMYLVRLQQKLHHLEDELSSISEQRALSSGSESDSPDSDSGSDNDEPPNKRSTAKQALHAATVDDSKQKSSANSKKRGRTRDNVFDTSDSDSSSDNDEPPNKRPTAKLASHTSRTKDGSKENIHAAAKTDAFDEAEYDSDPFFEPTPTTSNNYNKCLRPNNQANTVLKKRASAGENNPSNNRTLEKDGTISAQQKKKRIETESFEQQIEHVIVLSSILTAILKYGNLKQQSSSYEKLGTFVKNVTTLQKAEKTIVSKATSVVNPGPKRKSSKDAALRGIKDLHTNLLPAKKWSEVAGLLNSFSMNVSKLFKDVSSLYRAVQSPLKASLEENIYKKFSDYCEVLPDKPPAHPPQQVGLGVTSRENSSNAYRTHEMQRLAEIINGARELNSNDSQIEEVIDLEPIEGPRDGTKSFKITSRAIRSLQQFQMRYTKCKVEVVKTNPQISFLVALVDSAMHMIEDVHNLDFIGVLPPDSLYHPVLPQKVGDKLLFHLCKICSAQKNHDTPYCTHTDDERSFDGSWSSWELNLARKFGYKITEIYEIWHYEKTTKYKKDEDDGLFTSFVNAFLKLKQVNIT
ncbi:Hypothetical predicted protein [Cloeon dipterum]|uniref:Uncharacterized protein n=1 Tax=Cloeon dipterum TaxID=197152 RepID=A0A8S1DT96_9INSE|nr:Hypothetical predicted protein [Cloeon dipterum]